MQALKSDVEKVLRAEGGVLHFPRKRGGAAPEERSQDHRVGVGVAVFRQRHVGMRVDPEDPRVRIESVEMVEGRKRHDAVAAHRDDAIGSFPFKRRAGLADAVEHGGFGGDAVRDRGVDVAQGRDVDLDERLRVVFREKRRHESGAEAVGGEPAAHALGIEKSNRLHDMFLSVFVWLKIIMAEAGFVSPKQNVWEDSCSI